jgi:hypothetical protein
MIFPNRRPEPEIRPGMGYSAGATNRMGYVAHMGYTPGANFLSGLGDFSPSMENAAVDAGIQPSDIDLLNNLGATDQDLQNLINGTVTLQQLYAQYGATIPSTSAAAATAAATPSASAASSTPAPQIPPGSTILYTASYNPVSGWTTSSQAINALSPLLPAHGMSLLSSTVSASGLISNASFSVTIMDSIGNNLVSDAKSVLDALMNQITNNGLQSSSLTVVSPGTSASGAAAAATTPTTDPVTWLETNALWIALGVGGIILLNNFTSGKRR